MQYTDEKGRALRLAADLREARDSYRVELPPGEYMVCCGAPALLDQSRTGIVVRAGEGTRVDFQLAQGGAITGRIVTNDGGRVWVALEAFAEVPNPRTLVKVVAADPTTGEYRIEALRTGEYTLRVVSEGRGMVTPVDLRAAGGGPLPKAGRQLLAGIIREIVEGRMLHRPESLRHYAPEYRQAVRDAEGTELTHAYWRSTLLRPLPSPGRQEVALDGLEVLVTSSQADRAGLVTREFLQVSDRSGQRPATRSTFDRVWWFVRREGKWKLVGDHLLCDHEQAMVPSLRRLAPELTGKRPEWFRYVPAARVPQLHRVRVIAGEETSGHNYDMASGG
ncbi:MAG: carboxypeptidase-like regulatory domain-containing protein [Armatimonadota bacterium]